MKLIALPFLIFPLWACAQSHQNPSTTTLTHYVLQTDIRIHPYSFADENMDSERTFLARENSKFDLYTSIEDSSGLTQFYIIQFWDFENAQSEYAKKLIQLHRKLDRLSGAKQHADLLEKSAQADSVEIEKINRKIQQLENQKTRKRAKTTHQIDGITAQQNAQRLLDSTSIGYPENGSYFAIPARLFKRPQVALLNNSISNEGSQTTLSFVGAGDVQKSINEGPSATANTGLGVLFSQQWTDHRRLISGFEFDFSINVASTADTIHATYTTEGAVTNSRDFGTYLLLPMNSGQATRFKLYSYFNPDKLGFFKNSLTLNPHYLTNLISGFNVEFVASNRVWSSQLDQLNATGMMIKMGIFHEFVPASIRLEKDYSIKIGVSGSFRGIYGDAGFNDVETQAFRMDLLGTIGRQFYGVEVDLSIRIKNIEARVSIPGLRGTGNPVPGLSDTQFVTSITFVGGFPISVAKKERTAYEPVTK
jgi:hypothetical protein